MILRTLIERTPGIWGTDVPDFLTLAAESPFKLSRTAMQCHCHLFQFTCLLRDLKHICLHRLAGLSPPWTRRDVLRPCLLEGFVRSDQPSEPQIVGYKYKCESDGHDLDAR